MKMMPAVDLHARQASESGKGIEYFLNPAAEDSEALEIML
jgi:hypothetical protein